MQCSLLDLQRLYPLHLILNNYDLAMVLLLLMYCFMYLPFLWGFFVSLLFWYASMFVLSSFAINLTWKRELVALLVLSFGCLVTVRGSFFMFVESGCISTNIEFTVP